MTSSLAPSRRARLRHARLRRGRTVAVAVATALATALAACTPRTPDPEPPSSAIPGELLITAVGLADAAPDMAKITATIRTEAPTAPVAASVANRRVNAMTAALARIGVEADAVWSTAFRTEVVNLAPLGGGADSLLVPRPRPGMAVSHTLEIALTDVQRSGAVVDAIQGIPNLTIDRVITFPRDLATPTRVATDRALEHATRQAEAFVRRVGATGMHLLKADAMPLALDSLVAPDGGRHVVRIRLTTTWRLDAPTSAIPPASVVLRRPAPTAADTMGPVPDSLRTPRATAPAADSTARPDSAAATARTPSAKP